MHDVRANPYENTLYLSFKGKLELAEAQSAAQEILRSARKLQPGFVKITDIRELAPAAEDVRLEIQKIMKDLVSLGLAGAIRLVAPDGAITANQFQRTSRAVGYMAREVQTMAQAERLIDEMS